MVKIARLGVNSAWMLLSRLGAQGLAVLFTVLIARQLGGRGFGEYAFISAALYLGNALTTFGTDMLIIREIAGRDDLSNLFPALILQLGLSAVFIGLVILAAPLVPNQSPEAVAGLRLYSLSLVPLAFFSVFTIALRGRQRMAAYMLLNLASAVMQVAAAWLALRLGGNVVLLVAFLLVAQVFTAILAGLFCAKQIPGFWRAWQFSRPQVLPLLRACAPIALLALLGLTYQKLSIYMLSAMGGALVTGWFSAALRTVEASKTAHLAVFTALYPVMAQDLPSAGGSARLSAPWRGAFGASWWLLLAGAGATALVLFVLAAPLALFLYGPAYGASILPIKILAWVLIPFTVNNFFSLSLLAARKEAVILWVQLAGLLALAFLNAWWIPRWGLPGACLACVAAESIQAAAYLYPRRLIPQAIFRFLRFPSPQHENLGLPQHENLGLPPTPSATGMLRDSRSGEGTIVRNGDFWSPKRPKIPVLLFPAFGGLFLEPFSKKAKLEGFFFGGPMSFPNYVGKYQCRPMLTAQDIVSYRRRLGRLADVPGLEGVLLCLERGLPRRMRWQIPLREAGKMNGDLYAVKKTKNKVAVMANFGGGSPMVVSLAEEFIAMGARRLVLMTGGGGLQPDLNAGDIIVCRRAIRDEGVSYHYLAPDKYVEADVQLGDRLASAIQARGRPCTFGATWTTDAGFMETIEEVRQYQAEGVKTVEMESAGLFALAQARRVPAVSAVVVMDSLAGSSWQAPEKVDAIQRSLEIVYAAAIEVLAG